MTPRIAGFTLIELIVVVSIIAILSGSSIAAFTKFNERQALGNDARQLVTELIKAKNLAASMQYPTGCLMLRGINIKSVSIAGSLSGTQIVSMCDTGNVSQAILLTLKSSVFSAPLDITFLPGSGYLLAGVDQSTTINYKQDETLTKTITINTYGQISFL